MITVLIPSYNRPTLLKEALDSLKSNSELVGETIVLSPASDNGYEKICADLGASLVDDQSRVDGKRVKSLWQVLNRGIDLARGEYVCWLNDDCTVLPGWDRLALAAFSKPSCGLVSLKTKHSDGPRDFMVLPTLYGVVCANYGMIRKAEGLRFDERFSWFHGDADIALQAEFILNMRVYGTDGPCVVHAHVRDAVRKGNESDDRAKADWLYLNRKWWKYYRIGSMRIHGVPAAALNSGGALLKLVRKAYQRVLFGR